MLILLTLLEEVSGDQRYILDYLTEEVLATTATGGANLSALTCILERLTASLCDAVMQQTWQPADAPTARAGQFICGVPR